MCNVTNYYIDGNTAKGYRNLLASNLHNITDLYSLTNASETDCTRVVNEIGSTLSNMGYETQYLHSCRGGNIAGVLFPTLGLGFAEASYLNCNSHRIDLSASNINFTCPYAKAYELLAQALTIHDEWEKFYISNMDFDRANALTDELINQLLGSNHQDKIPVTYHRFLGGATACGPIDFVDSLTAGVAKRYFIKGRPGSGKSTILKKIMSSAQKKGFDVEVYHCGFDPDSLDMVIVRELDFAIFDSTPPHEYFPERNQDIIVDVYSQVMKNDTDMVYRDELTRISLAYKAKIKEATAALAVADRLMTIAHKDYSPISHEKIQEVVNFALDKIKK